jgi:hypothetical protein
MGSKPDTSAQDRMIAQQQDELNEQKRKLAQEEEKTSKKRVAQMRSRLAGSLFDATQQPSDTIGG